MSYKKHGGEGGGDGGDKGGDEGHTPSCTRAKFQELLAQVKDLRFELSAEVSDLLANEDLDLRKYRLWSCVHSTCTSSGVSIVASAALAGFTAAAHRHIPIQFPRSHQTLPQPRKQP